MRERINIKGDDSPEALALLERLLFNGNGNNGIITMFKERALAAGALGNIGGERARAALERAKGDKLAKRPYACGSQRKFGNCGTNAFAWGKGEPE